MPDYVLKIASKPQNLPGVPSQVVPVERLVRAPNKARAIAHVVKDSITVETATTDDVIRLTAAGAKLEQAE